MEFFDKLSKKASETYKFTKDKTTKISGELKLKGKINDLKSKIEDVYKEIGKIVYEELKSGTDVSKEEVSPIWFCECGYQECIGSIEELKEKAVDCPENIELHKPYIDDVHLKCSKCGKEQPEEVKNIEVKAEEPANAEQAEVVEVKNADEEQKDETNE